MGQPQPWYPWDFCLFVGLHMWVSVFETLMRRNGWRWLVPGLELFCCRIWWKTMKFVKNLKLDFCVTKQVWSKNILMMQWSNMLFKQPSRTSRMANNHDMTTKWWHMLQEHHVFDPWMRKNSAIGSSEISCWWSSFSGRLVPKLEKPVMNPWSGSYPHANV